MGPGAPEPPAILIVEDDEAVRETMLEILEERGFRVIAAVNGSDALAALASGPRPCLILLDWMMPVMDGEELVAALRSDPDLATIPLVVLSAMPPTRVKGLRILKKPIGMPELLAIVAEHCPAPAPQDPR